MKYLTILGLISLLAYTCLTITIPLVQNTDRCMIVYTSTPDENLILDMKFPKIPNILNGQTYKITITNTEDKTYVQERVTSGTFRKELDLIESVVYKVCFAILTNRSIGSVIIEYNAETKFTNQLQTVKVPQSLLRTDDFQNTYAFAQNIYSLTEISLQFQKDRRAKQDAIYAQNRSNIDTLYWISIFQILVILLTGFYQFFSVRTFLIAKHYL